MKKILLMLALVVSSLNLAGCYEDKIVCTVGETTDDSISVADYTGCVTVPTEPSRIVDLSGSSDFIATLGYTVVGTANTNAYARDTIDTYQETLLSDATVLGNYYDSGMSAESILNLEPDLIIISTVQEALKDSLSAIAPVAMVEHDEVNWQNRLTMIGDILGEETATEDWISAYNTKAAALGQAIIAKNGSDKTYAVSVHTLDSEYPWSAVFDSDGIAHMIYNDLGLGRSSSLVNSGDWTTITIDNASSLNAFDIDYLFAMGDTLGLADVDNNFNGTSFELGGVIPYFSKGYYAIGRLQLLDEIAAFFEINEY